VKTVAVKEEGAAAVESVTTAAKAGGVFKRNEYRVRDGVQGIFITSILRNESDKVQKVNTKADFSRFNETGEGDGVFWTSAVDPADKVGYAQVVLNLQGTEKSGGESRSLRAKKSSSNASSPSAVHQPKQPGWPTKCAAKSWAR